MSNESLKEVLVALEATPQSASTLLTKVNMSRPTLFRKLKDLVAQGLAVKEGAGPRSAYRQATVLDNLRTRHAPTPHTATLALTRSQGHLMVNALELLARLGIWQFAEITHQLRWAPNLAVLDSPDWSEQIEKAEACLARLKARWSSYGVHAGPGIYSSKNASLFTCAWAIHHMLRHRLAWDQNPEGSMGVWHDEPLSGDLAQNMVVWSEGQGDAYSLQVQLEPEHLAVVEEALFIQAEIWSGRLGFLNDWIQKGLLRNQAGQPLPASVWEESQDVIALIEAVLKQGDFKSLAAVVGLLQALRAAEPEVRQEGGLKWDKLQKIVPPKEYSLIGQGSVYKVIQRRLEDEKIVLLNVAHSHSAQTALLMARNHAEGKDTRKFSL